MAKQLASDVLLIEPTGFGANAETADSNAFQSDTIPVDVSEKVIVEHRRLVAALRDKGVRTVVFQPHRDDLPDAVFPNNWFSTDMKGRLLLYPMEASSRQREVRPHFAAELSDEGYSIDEVVDLREGLSRGVLEGTGSLVLDHAARIAYAVISSRTEPAAVEAWCDRFGYEACLFSAVDPSSRSVYHTNVIMGLGSSLAIICLDAIPDSAQRKHVAAILQETSREILEISWEQVCAFAGNVLFLQGSEGEIMMISQSGWTSLTERQREQAARHAQPVPVAVDTIESIGGGSVRCMIAEIFLPRK